MNEGNCKSCHQRIIWAKTPSGSSMPLDPEPHPNGNRYLDENGFTGPVEKGDRPDERKRYLSHFATCKFAAQHRGKKK